MKHEVIAEWQMTKRKIKLSFDDTISASKLKEILEQIPDSATLDEIIYSVGDCYAFIFHHEFKKPI